MSLSLSDRHGFVTGVELGGLGVKLSVGKNTIGAVSGGAAIAFDGLSSQLRADVLNSILLAQLAATKKYNRQQQTEEWYGEFVDILEKIGWVAQNFHFDKLDRAESYSTVDQIVSRISGTFLTGNESSKFNALVEALKSSSNKTALSIFNKSTEDANKANFIVGVTTESQGNAALKVLASTYTSSETIDTTLFLKLANKKVEYYSASQELLLNRDIYNQVREAILEKLGDNAHNLVENVQA